MNVDKGFMVTLASALLTAVQTTGCAAPAQNQAPAVTESVDAAGEESTVATSRDLEVAAQLGISQTRIDDMQQNGMKLRDRSHIRMAEHLMDLLAAKYGFDVEAQSIVAPEIADQSWRFQARVASGEHAGVSFRCELPADGDDSALLDDLVSRVRADELQAYVESLVMDVCGDQVAHWVGNCIVNETMLGADVTLDSPEEALAQSIETGVWLYFGPEYPLGESGYKETARKLQEALAQHNVACVVTMRHLTHLSQGQEGSGLSLGAAQQVVQEGESGVDYEWELTFGPHSQEEV